MIAEKKKKTTRRQIPTLRELREAEKRFEALQKRFDELNGKAQGHVDELQRELREVRSEAREAQRLLSRWREWSRDRAACDARIMELIEEMSRPEGDPAFRNDYDASQCREAREPTDRILGRILETVERAPAQPEVCQELYNRWEGER